MTRKRLRHAGLLLLPLLAPAISWITLVRGLIPLTTAQPVLLVCGDFSDAGSFAHGVFQEAQRASRGPQARMLANFKVEQLDDEGDSATSQFQQRFLDALASRFVVGVISANTSQNAPPVIRLADTFRLPTLVTVATTNVVLAQSVGYTLRMVPNDVKQAEAMAEWVRKGQYQHVAVMYHQSEYGDFLSRTLLKDLESRGTHAVRMAFQNTPAVGQGLRGLKSCPLDALIYVGYRQDLPDLLRCLDVHELRLPLLVSDGCFSTELPVLVRTFHLNLALSFPVDPFPRDKVHEPGFGSYGNDAAYMFAYALMEASADKNTLRERLMPSLLEIIKDRSIDPKFLSSSYRFQRCENEAAAFRTIPLASPDSQGAP